MEKITKEELFEKIGGTPLSDDELEQVAGGFTCEQSCQFLYDVGDPRLISCKDAC